MSVLGGMVAGTVAGDILGSVAMRSQAIPATSSSATSKSTADGKPVSSTTTPRQSLYMSAFIVIGAIAVLLFGSKFLKDARIG